MGGPLLKRAALSFGALLVIVGLAVAYQLWSIRADLERAERRIEQMSLESAATDGLDGVAGPAVDAIRRADSRANGFLLGAVGRLPVLDGQIDALRELTGTVAVVADEVDVQLDHLDAAFEQASTPEGTVALADALLDATDALGRSLDSLPPLEHDDLVGPLRSASADLEDALDRGSEKLTELREHIVTGRDLLVGPTKVLVLAANNAEQRAGMGMHLSAGVVTIEDGEFTTADFTPTETLTAFTRGRASYPDELRPIFEEIWDYGREWRTVSSTPNYPVVGSVFDQLAELVGFGPVDAVVSVDALALVGLLEATGPIEVEGQNIRADNVVDRLLRDNYLAFAGEGESSERRELQGEIASSIFSALTEREVDPLELASELATAAEGRHLLAWSDDRDLQALWETLGADGALTPRSFMVSVQNATGSKRDYYLDPVASLQALADDRSDLRRYRATATLTNPVVDPTAEVVEGTNPFVPPGVHRAYVTFTLPGAATAVEVVDGQRSRAGTDGPTELVAVWIRVPVTQTRRAAVEFDLPTSVRSVDLLPSARLRPVTYTIGALQLDDARATRVVLPVGPVEEHEPKIPEALGLMLAFAGLLLLVGRSRRLTRPDPDVHAARVDLIAGTSFVAVGIAVLIAFSV